VIQTHWMRNLAKEISKDSAWAIDSTFKTNRHGLLLYAAMCPNKQGVGMPVFFMLCSANVGSNHESVALKLFSRVWMKYCPMLLSLIEVGQNIMHSEK
jgi:hypothetical protein